MSQTSSHVNSDIKSKGTETDINLEGFLGTSLFDALNISDAAKNKAECLTSVLLVSKKPQQLEPHEIVKIHEDIFQSVLSEKNASLITGVMIIQKDTILHLYETTEVTSVSFIRSILKSVYEISKSRIIAIVQDYGDRFFSKWFHYHMNLQPEPNLDLYREDLIQVSSSIFINLSKLHDEMLSISSISSSELRRTSSHLIASNERCLALSECEDFIDISTFLTVYSERADIQMEDDLMVLPIQYIEDFMRRYSDVEKSV